MTDQLGGIHHITGVAGDPQANIDFYTGVLGMRLIKVTINYDDPESYHFYFADRVGAPGSVMTFFPFPGAQRGRIGTGQVAVVAYNVPEGSFDFWIKHLSQHGVEFEAPARRFDEEFIALRDTDGQTIELVAGRTNSEFLAWDRGPVPPEFGISSFHSATLSVAQPDGTIKLLSETMGFKQISQSGDRIRFEVADGGVSRIVDLLALPRSERGQPGAGTIHHIAWRCKTAEDQIQWRDKITALGYHVTPVVERNYFKSVYFRESGGILFEIATDLPGFAIDEPLDKLGSRVMLPPWMESNRNSIESRLPSIKFPKLHLRNVDVAN